MNDAGEPEPGRCDTLGCENESVENDYYIECADALAGEDFTRAYHPARQQYATLPSDHFITDACNEGYYKLGKINSAEGESHLPTGGSSLTRTCFFLAQDNIVCHLPSHGYQLLSLVVSRVNGSLGHDGGPDRQRWNDGAHP